VVRITDTRAKYIFCDPEGVKECAAAAKLIPWPVEILVFGNVEGYQSVDSLFESDENHGGELCLEFSQIWKGPDLPFVYDLNNILFQSFLQIRT
jgi:hypothetical protein